MGSGGNVTNEALTFCPQLATLILESVGSDAKADTLGGDAADSFFIAGRLRRIHIEVSYFYV